MNDLLIRDARQNDQEAIREVTLAAYQKHATQMPIDWEGYRQNILATLAAVAAVKTAEHIVAEQKGSSTSRNSCNWPSTLA
jgi:hypothetical protein